MHDNIRGRRARKVLAWIGNGGALCGGVVRMHNHVRCRASRKVLACLGVWIRIAVRDVSGACGRRFVSTERRITWDILAGNGAVETACVPLSGRGAAEISEAR